MARPVGSKDSKPRKRRGKVVKKEPWESKGYGKGKTPANKTKSRLLLDRLNKYNFDPIQEIINLFDNFSLQYELGENPDGKVVKIYPQHISNQMADILKTFLNLCFPRQKAVEISGNMEKPIELVFNIGDQQKPKKVEHQEEEKEQAIDLISGPGGIHLPVPAKDTE